MTDENNSSPVYTHFRNAILALGLAYGGYRTGVFLAEIDKTMSDPKMKLQMEAHNKRMAQQQQASVIPLTSMPKPVPGN